MPYVKLSRRERRSINERARHVLHLEGRPRMCEICTRLDYEAAKVGGLGVYHVWEPGWGGGQEPENLRFYCRECYEWVRERRRAITELGRDSSTSTASPSDGRTAPRRPPH